MAADFDAIVVGAGCAGSVAAYVLAAKGKSVLLVERGEDAGSKNMTGGRLYAHALREVLPHFEDNAPLERKITTERISLITQDECTTVSFASPRLGEAACDSYAVLRGPFDRWLASQAEDAGAECVFGIAVEDVLWDEDRIAGIVAGGDALTAEVVIIADGVNSLLTEKAKLASRPRPHQIAVGVKETIALSERVISDRFCAADGEGSAWLFAGAATQGHVGGGFLYTNRDSISIGLVATLSDLCTSAVPIYQMMEDFKAHPSIAPLLRGGSLAEYSGHLIPEGGLAMVPELCRDGCLVAGDAAMLCINLGYQVRGMDYAIASGRIAAEVAAEALDAGDTSANRLSAYKLKLSESFVLKDMQAHRDFPAFMEGTPRIFKGYPEMAADIMRGMFAVDGSPVRPMKRIAMEPVKRMGVLTLLKDVRRGMRAL
ncbi:FAD-dependent oxidoreductase [Gordonibacter sp. An230]|uniref:FAD-dependent oxidoreductase n=1 Tax=Gordonibacter sp. An230 TaxID=1965592 RepID=UPI000B3A7DDB|nr:FAD-dependent oxidoreductase [Gordonibacter sp. An230]OUO89779.1 FAD-dependent oxidoreductase [Gordonibacter sp. An230]